MTRRNIDPNLPTVHGLYPLPFFAVMPAWERVRVDGRWLDGVSTKTLLTDCTLVQLQALQIEPSDERSVRILLTEFGIGSRPYFETPLSKLDEEGQRGLNVTRGLLWTFPEPLSLHVSQNWWLQLYNTGYYQQVVTGCLWAMLPPKSTPWATPGLLGSLRRRGDIG